MQFDFIHYMRFAYNRKSHIYTQSFINCVKFYIVYYIVSEFVTHIMYIDLLIYEILFIKYIFKFVLI